MDESFSAGLWDSISDIYGAILAHPFLTGLTDGTLPAESFAFYVIQDALYLREYARALAAVASRAPTAGATRMFAGHAADAIAAELELHGALLDELGIPPEMLQSAEPAPTNLAYTSYLLATVRGGSYAEGVGAVLPCYWIYAAVGKELIAPRLPGSALPALDCHLRRRRVRRCRGRCDQPSSTAFRTAFPKMSAPEYAVTSGRRAGTSGCSGRWGGPRNPGPSDRSKPLGMRLR